MPYNSKLRTRKFRKHNTARYGSRDYTNPFFQQRKKTRINIEPLFSWKFKLAVALIIVTGLASAWFFLYSPVFRIKNIDISGEGRFVPTDKIRSEVQSQIDNNMFVLWPQKNIFFFNTEKSLANLKTKYSFDQLSINKKLPSTLDVQYQEKQYSIIWQENEKYYYIDNSGSVIGEASPAEITQKDYPIIINFTGININNNQAIIDSKYLVYTNNLFQELKKHSEELKVQHFIVDNEINTVKVALQSGPQIYFNTDENIDKQINKLLIVKREKIQDTFNNKLYIDVRLGDAVYYR